MHCTVEGLTQERVSGAPGRSAMLPISVQAQECREYAEHCAQSARNQPDPQIRQSYLEMQRRWLGLARSYEFSDQLVLYFFYRNEE